jgi:hypothetical protein
MARPQAEIRTHVAQAIARSPQPLTWLDVLPAVPGLNAASPADRELVRCTINNMARAGQLVRVDRRRVLGAARPMNTWRAAVSSDPRPDVSAAVAAHQALIAWCRGSAA